MGVPLSRVLLDFGAAKPPASPSPSPSPAMAIVPVCDAGQDAAARLDEAYARGEAAARIAAEAEREQKLAEAMAHAGQQHATERARWASEQADELAARLTSAVATLEARIAEMVGRVLTPFLTSQLRSRSVEALAESIGTLLSGGSNPALRISGPDDLLSALRDRLGASPLAIEWETNGQAEVTVLADDSVIETEIQSWMERLAGARR